MDTSLRRLHHHAVQFYGTDESLFLTASGFLAEGLLAGGAALVIATPSHRAAIRAHLSGQLVDCDGAEREGRLLWRDAQEVLDLLMTPTGPDADLFGAHVGALVERTIAGRPSTVLRAYGEMVDLLWKRGRTQAAIDLEMLWNTLALKHTFALLCGYAMGSFFKQTLDFEQVCAQHTLVLDADPPAVRSAPGAQTSPPEPS